MIRKRKAGVQLYDQIRTTKQAIFVSDNGSHVIFISMKGVVYISIEKNLQEVINEFSVEIKFEYDVKFINKFLETEQIYIVLSMRLPSGKTKEKIEFQFVDFHVENQTVNISNLGQTIRKPLEFMNKEHDCEKPMIARILSFKNTRDFVIGINYSDRSLEHSKLFLAKASGDKQIDENYLVPKVLITVPILQDLTDGISSTSRNCYIQDIQ